MSEGGIEIYDGRHRLGFVIEQSAEWRAYGDDNRVIGVYPSKTAAAKAIASAGRLQARCGGGGEAI